MMSEGLKGKYHITKADGRPCHGRYFVLKLDSKDEEHAKACQKAAYSYAHQIRKHLPELSNDIKDSILDFMETDSWEMWDRLIGEPGGESEG
jgi:hypothetical protein